MNKNHLKLLCEHFNLGNQKQDPERVHGGLLHIMWRLNTDKASYAIKQLSKDINLANEHDPEQHQIGTEQVMQVLATIVRLHALIPELIKERRL